ncbi:N-acetyltransferase family 8 member 3-like [Scyliorhinus canicula]|uniref:N-acetyltransferase family 8 member 3-like n=1 Tax=Scyliorhinus canicula TaxID=7830 RepID=UPI0018F548D7|nr:N-acetyltransferase family 8 member 3-like [Scyliorhinus canicula]
MAASWAEEKAGRSYQAWRIRRCREEDVEAVRRIYADAVMEQAWPTFRRAAWSLRTLVSAGAVGGLSLAVTGRPLAVPLAWLALAALVYGACRYLYAASARGILGGDLGDVEGSFLGRPGACFWVVEEGGGSGSPRLVGTLGAKPAPGEPSACELCRLTVSLACRRRGLGRALLETGLEFARRSGYLDCTVYTSDIHHAALALYSKAGFQLQRAFPPPEGGPLLHSICQVTDYQLRLKLSLGRSNAH